MSANMDEAWATLERVEYLSRDNWEALVGPSKDGPGWINGVRRPITAADRRHMEAASRRASVPLLRLVRRADESPASGGSLQLLPVPHHRGHRLGQLVDLSLEPSHGVLNVLVGKLRGTKLIGRSLAQLAHNVAESVRAAVGVHRSSSAVWSPGAGTPGRSVRSVEAPADKTSFSAGRRVAGWLRGLREGSPRSRTGGDAR